MRLISPIILVLALFAVSGCAVTARTDVTTFHTLPTAGQAETFTIEPGPGKDVASLEFQAYATQVTQRLYAYGWRPAAADAAPTYRVVLDFGVSPPEYQQRLEPYYPGYYPFHYGNRRWGYWPVGPTYVPVVDRYFARTLDLRVFRTVRGTERGPAVYEGRAVNRGRSDEITPVMPVLVNALFRNFPGVSGKTVTVEEQLN
jgi:hypothetical protein